METRQLKDAEGNVLVEISLPIGTSETTWAYAFSAYIPYTPENEEL